jgi:hypothetical protein
MNFQNNARVRWSRLPLDGGRQPEVGSRSGHRLDGGVGAVQASLDRGANLAGRRPGPQES